eukprot:scaffold249313_cov74-Cyclotella_meneghiniana.AAC.4
MAVASHSNEQCQQATTYMVLLESSAIVTLATSPIFSDGRRRGLNHLSLLVLAYLIGELVSW